MSEFFQSFRVCHVLWLFFISFVTPQANLTEEHQDTTSLVSYVHHHISPYAKNNVEICKSSPFAPTQLNYRRSGTDEWLKKYTLEIKDREYFKKHGLPSTIAYDFLGDTNFKCAIGLQSSCVVQCLNVVGHIEDLELARRVYFALVSTGHFVSSIGITHDALEAAQSNVGLMAGRMSYTFYWVQPSAEEIQRAVVINQLSEISLWAAQSALNSIMPLVPWSSMRNWVILKASGYTGPKKGPDIDAFPSSDDEVSETQLVRYTLNNEYLPDAPYTLRIPPRFGGNLWWNPDGASIASWWYNNGKFDGRLNKQDFCGEWEGNKMLRYNEKQPGEEDNMSYQYGWFPDFRARWNVHGFVEAASHAWGDFKNLCSGTLYDWRRFVHGVWPSAESERIQDEYFNGYGKVDGHTVTRQIWNEGMDEKRNWMARVAAGEYIPEDQRRQQPAGKLRPEAISYITYLRTKNKLDPPTKLSDDMQLVSWGSTTERQALGRYEGWDSYDQYHLEQISKTWPIPDIPERTWIEGTHDAPEIPKIAHTIYGATERVANVARMIFPIVSSGVVKSMVSRVSSGWAGGGEIPREWNEMGLQWYIQESGRIARTALKETVNRIMRSEEIKEDGSTELVDLLALGSYLPATDGVLGAWTNADVEDTLTKNVFYKVLNFVMNSQKTFISCTSDFKRMKGKRPPLMLPNPLLDMETVETCEKDDIGPQDRKACIDNITVCYMYRWNDRNNPKIHGVEDSFGFNELSGDPWNLNATDIITSSFWSHVMGLRDVQISSKLSILNDGPTVEQAADPQTPGLFTIPICLSKYNWNTKTDRQGFIESVNPYSSHKALPCYCGNLGKDTVPIWQAMGITTATEINAYARNICPAQINTKIQDWLERYIAYCQIGIRRSSIMETFKNGRDGMCGAVITELEGVQIVSTLDLEPEHRTAFKCKIKGSKSNKCKSYAGSPVSKVWGETIDAIRERKEKELKEVKKVVFENEGEGRGEGGEGEGEGEE